MGERGLTEKQERFVDYWFEVNGNASEAARLAGYKHPYVLGAQNLENPRIRAAIEARKTELKARRVADGDEVMERLSAILRQEATEEVVAVEGQGEGMSRARILQKHADLKAVLKAAELLQRVYLEQSAPTEESITFIFDREAADADD